MNYLSLFLSFFKMGLFTFGGGYAMLPLIEKEMVEKKKVISNEEMTDIIAISESTPGPLAINCATFIGFRVKGFWGSLIATLAVVLPSLIIIFLISLILESFLANEYVGYAFAGIRIAVALLIVKASINMFRKSKKNLIFYILLLVALILTLFFTNINPAFIILGGGIVGFIIALIKQIKDGHKDDLA